MRSKKIPAKTLAAAVPPRQLPGTSQEHPQEHSSGLSEGSPSLAAQENHHKVGIILWKSAAFHDT